MASLNRVELIGRLGDDPDLRYTGEGTAVASLALATDESYTRNDGTEVDQTEWHDVTVFGRQAETVNEYTGKGDQVYVEGNLETSQYTDRDGIERYSTSIKARRVLFLESPRDRGSPMMERQDPSQGTPKVQGQEAQPTGPDDETFEPDDELPF